MNGKDKMSKPENHPVELHDVSMANRERLTMSGVKDVSSFNENIITLETVMGPCVIEGEGLNIQQLSLDVGKMVVNGKVNMIDYRAMQSKGKSFFKRVFK